MTKRIGPGAAYPAYHAPELSGGQGVPTTREDVEAWFARELHRNTEQKDWAAENATQKCKRIARALLDRAEAAERRLGTHYKLYPWLKDYDA